MQHRFSLVPKTLGRIERTISSARLARYLPAAGGDRQLALRLYIWNARICEAFYLPMQFAEVSARNAIHIPVKRRFGEEWYQNPKFRNLLSKRHLEQLEDTVRKEKAKRGRNLNENHIIGGSNFGFWTKLMTKAFDKQLWANGVRWSFPQATRNDDREVIFRRLESLRSFRNDIAHHYAVFDKGPQAQLANTLKVIHLTCEDSHWLSAEICTVSTVINQRPKT